MNRLWEILFKPAEIYEGMKEDPSPVLPMVTVVVILAVCAVLAVALVDSEAILAEQLEVQATMLEQMNVPEEQREMQLEQTRQALQSPAAGVMGLISAPAGAVVIYFILVVLLTVYLLIVSKTMNLELGFSDWFAFTCWGFIPMIFPAIVGVIGVIADPGTLAQTDWLAPLNWFSLTVGGYEGALSLDNILMVFIMTMGFQAWSEKSTGVSLAVVLIPFVVGTVISVESTRALGSMFGGLVGGG